MNKYVIQRAARPVELTGQVSGAWAGAEVARIDEFPWYKAGRKQATEVRALWDDEGLYIQFLATDVHIFSKVIDLNGPVCTDSCVEFFATIDPARGPDYFNFESNCCGVLLVGWGPDRHTRKPISAELARRISVASSESPPAKAESPSDRSWWLAAALPFDVLSEFSGTTIRPQKGTVWRGNFYRCGGATDDQYACWNPIVSPRPDFHLPEHFGELQFA